MGLFHKRELIEKADQRIVKGIYESAQSILKSQFNAYTEERKYDIFLSHSFADAKQILGLKLSIEELGYSVYVDWIEDRQMSRSSVSRKTAETLRNRMKNCSCLLYATSENSSTSTWMPWELGYFDGIKGQVAILPVTDFSSNSWQYEGKEYLGLYPYVMKEKISGEDKMALWVMDSSKSYVYFEAWLKHGHQPYVR